MIIHLSRPDITDLERSAVSEVLATPLLSMGPKVLAFEQAFVQRLGCRHAAAVNSGTSALVLALLAMSIGPGDEIVTTPFSFIASSNCILTVGATPVFADIDPHTWNLDPTAAAAAVTPRTRALLPVDVFGNPVDMDRLTDLACRHGLRIVEDSCEALGASYKGRPAGRLGEIGVFGFYPNKQITTGEGGMVVTDDAELHTLVVSMRNQGRGPGGGWLAHERLGFNHRLSDINCALGLAQMQRLSEILAKRERVAALYRERLRDEPRIQLQQVTDGARESPFVFVVRLGDEYSGDDRDRFLNDLQQRGIGCSNYFPPIHLQPFYAARFRFKRGDFPVCEALAERTIALPFHANLTEAEVDEVCRTVVSLLSSPKIRRAVG